jgi:LacI family transcriptional regulator
VADAAGVHRSTASRALDPAATHLVAREVAARIQAAARQLGYRRDVVAASLRTKRSRLVGAVVPDIANPVFGPILAAMETELRRNGFAAIVANAGPDPEQQAEVVEHLIARRVEGLVLATVRQDDPVLTHCIQANVPTVLVNRAETGQRVSAVVSDDALGLRLAVEHLTSLGHRWVGHLAGPGHLSTGALRRRGYEDAMQAAGLAENIVVVEAEVYAREAGRAAARALLDRSAALTAVAAANDLLALGLYEELKARNLSCPDDVSVVGHNDMPLVDMVAPPLTTIRIGHAEMGAEAARLLLRQIGESTPPVTRVTTPVLIVRGSTSAPVGSRRGAA